MNTLESLKTKMAKTVTVSDFVLAALFEALPDTGVCQLEKSNRLLHEIFYKLKQKPEFSNHEILRELVFDESLPTPYSEDIDTALFKIETAHILETKNPSYKGYLIKEENTKYVTEALNKFEDSEVIRKISKFVKEQLIQSVSCQP